MTEAPGSSLQFRVSEDELDNEPLHEHASELGIRRGEISALVALLTDARLSGDACLLDAAASLAGRHEALLGQEIRLRGLLGLLTLRCDLARELGDDPRHVFDDMERTATASARLKGETMRTIWSEPMLKPGAVAVALGARVTNREKVRRLRRRSALLGLPHGNGFLYPAFQVDSQRRVVFPEVRAVNEQLSSADDPWGVASWWVSRHSRLGARPVDLVNTNRADALAEVAGAVVEALG